jgi:hypothetical protein
VTKDGKKYSTVWSNVPENHRKCDDGGRHSGSLEIVTWETPVDEYHKEQMGWGCTLLEESAGLKKEFEVGFQADCNTPALTSSHRRS